MSEGNSENVEVTLLIQRDALGSDIAFTVNGGIIMAAKTSHGKILNKILPAAKHIFIGGLGSKVWQCATLTGNNLPPRAGRGSPADTRPIDLGPSQRPLHVTSALVEESYATAVEESYSTAGEDEEDREENVSEVEDAVASTHTVTDGQTDQNVNSVIVWELNDNANVNADLSGLDFVEVSVEEEEDCMNTPANETALQDANEQQETRVKEEMDTIKQETFITRHQSKEKNKRKKSQVSKLQEHKLISNVMLNHTDTFVCHLCGFTLSSFKQVLRHIQRVHPERSEILQRGTFKANVFDDKFMSEAAKNILQGDCNWKIETQQRDLETREEVSSHLGVIKNHDVDMTQGESNIQDKKGDIETKPLKECREISEEVLLSFVLHHFKEGVNDEYECSVCGESMQRDGHTLLEWLEHLAQHNLQPHKTTCLECMEYFSENYLYTHHMHVAHGKITSQRITGTLCCHVCKVNFQTVMMYEKHMLREHSVSDVFPCIVETCKFIAYSQTQLNEHDCITTSKKDEIPSEEICELCGQTSTTVHKHQLEDCPALISTFCDPFSCELCNRVFPSKALLQSHQRLAHKGPYKCPYDDCEKLFRMTDTLRCHINKIHLKRWKRSCPECGVVLADRTALRNHIKTVHENVRDIPCSWPGCEKMFLRKNAMNVHYRTHTGEKNLLCEYCSYGARQRTALNYHMRKQHSDKPYSSKLAQQGRKVNAQLNT